MIKGKKYNQLSYISEKYGTCERCGRKKTSLHSVNWADKETFICEECRKKWHDIWREATDRRNDNKMRDIFIDFMRNGMETKEIVQFT